MKLHKHLSNSVLLCAIVLVMMGNTAYNGKALSTLKEQDRYKIEKEFKEKQEKELQIKDREYLNSLIERLNSEDLTTKSDMTSNTNVDSPVAEIDKSIVSAYESYRSKNSDTVGWIKIPGTQVNYPIMYSPDNNYYLKRTPEKVSSVYGSIFLDQQSNGSWGVFNLLHGHNMNNGSMFADIAKMMKPDYFAKHKVIQIYDGTTLREYTALGCFQLDDRKESIPVQYPSMQAYRDKIDHYMTRSRVAGSYPEDCTDFLLMNTCWYGDSGGQKNLHAIVIAYRSN